jgi:uncharacterized DUF497 family protein
LGVLQFEWDSAKDLSNREKHGVGFDEAASVFDDDLAVAIPDAVHSLVEQRFGLFGTSASGRLLVVVYTFRDEVIRVISSRRMTPVEIRRYEKAR